MNKKINKLVFQLSLNELLQRTVLFHSVINDVYIISESITVIDDHIEEFNRTVYPWIYNLINSTIIIIIKWHDQIRLVIISNFLKQIYELIIVIQMG